MTEPLDAAPDVRFCNALDVAWVPVINAAGVEQRVTLLDVFRHGHTYLGLGHELTPLERESMHRFLPSVGAMVLAEFDGDLDDILDTGEFPADAVDRFANRHRDLFWAKHPEKPFLQRHDIHQPEFEAQVTPKRPLVDDDPKKSVAHPLMMLHPHVPGGSSAKWALRQDSRDPAQDNGTLLLLLVLTWWQTRRGNGKGPDGRQLENGNPGQAGIRPLSVHWLAPTLAQTVLAGIPEEWTTGKQVPMWADRTNAPTNLSQDPHGLWRTTYARNMPLVLWQSTDETPVPVGYVVGPDTASVPVLAANESDSLVAMHDRDYARLFTPVETKGVTTYKQVSGVEVSLASTEGYVRWFKNHLNRALTGWGQGRMAEPDYATWRLGVYSEVCHTTGAREYSDWVVLPTRSLAPAPNVEVKVALATQAIDLLKRAMFRPMTVACEGRAYKDAHPVALPGAVEKFYSDVEGDLADCIAALTADPTQSMAPFRDAFHNRAVEAFRAATESLLTPANAPNVYAARQQYATNTRRDIRALIPN